VPHLSHSSIESVQAGLVPEAEALGKALRLLALLTCASCAGAASERLTSTCETRADCTPGYYETQGLAIGIGGLVFMLP